MNSSPNVRAALLATLAAAATVAAVAADDRAAVAPATPPPAAGAAPVSVVAPAPPPKVVATRPVLDVGQVSRGETIAAEFVLENQGTGELVVRSVQPACGCTVASFDERIAPGGTGRVRASVDTKDLSGPIAKSITVLSNDPATPRLQLTVKADVRAWVVARPGYARFVHTQTQPASTTSLTVGSPDSDDFRVLEVVSPYPHVRVTAREATPAEQVEDLQGRQWRIDVELAEDAPVGPLRDFLVVRTNHPRQHELQIPLSGVVRPVLHLTPGAADFGELALAGQAREVVLTLVNFGQAPVEVRSVATDVAGAQARFEEIEKGKRWKIVVQLTPEIAKGRVEGKLKVETSSPVLPKLEVPLTGRVA